MKKILSFFSVLAIGASSTTLTLSSVKNRDIASVDTFAKEYERGISEELTDYFELNDLENEKVNDSMKNLDLNVYNYNSKKVNHKLTDNYEIVLNYFNYDSELKEIYVDYEEMLLKKEDSDLIKLLKTDEFKVGVNEAFKNELFVYKDNLVQFTPYLENTHHISSNNSVSNLTSVNNFRSNGYKVEFLTKWYWFGTYKVTLNNAATIELVRILWISGTVGSVIAFFAKYIPKIGTIVSAVIKIISFYLKSVANRVSYTNNGRGVYIWTTVVIVWYVKAL
ncbi:hypothetical protein SCHIN_v1c04720 [Spiroplasma chinense]|uniref:Uncharacterized protein n=1 Tax=Spiroplasma chinense TaxID=216932 RepID=A0A5B9Y4Q6_9MOLU|nr:hypothetical protein [Spiroplasma chinense]QEH61669.1 hypothetical protein SCHIN_v1c04720 [Spiroplasma chinense]